MSEVRRRSVAEDQVGGESTVGHVAYIMLEEVDGMEWKQVHPVGFHSGGRV